MMPNDAKVVGYMACEKCGAQAEVRGDGAVICTRTEALVAEAAAYAEELKDKLIAAATAACEKQKKNAGAVCGYKKEPAKTPS
jgi:hypothetical protein